MLMRSTKGYLQIALAIVTICLATSPAHAQTRFEFAKDWSAVAKLDDVDKSLDGTSETATPTTFGELLAQKEVAEGAAVKVGQTEAEPVPTTDQTQPSTTATDSPREETDATTVDTTQPTLDDIRLQDRPGTAGQEGNVETGPNKELSIPEPVQSLIAPAIEISKKIESLLKKVDRLKSREEALVKLIPEIDDVIYNAEEAVMRMTPALADLKAQIEKLGPAPNGKDVPEDAPKIAKERERLNNVNSALAGAIKQAELGRERASQLRGQIQSYRQNIFTKNLFERTSTPLQLSTWNEVLLSLPRACDQIRFIFSAWWDKHWHALPWIVALIALSIFVFFATRHALRATLRLKLPNDPNLAPSFLTRAATAGWVTAAIAMPLTLAASIIFFGFHILGLFDERIALLMRETFLGLLIFSVASALAHAYLQPNRPAWRLINISTPAARRTSWVIKGIAALYAIDMVLREGIRMLFLPLPVSIAEAFIASIGFSALLVAIVRTRFSPALQSADETVSLGYPRLLKIPLVIVAVFVVAAALLGYIALGRFVAGQVVLTGTTIVLIALLYLAIKAIAQDDHEEPSVPVRFLSSALGINSDYQPQVSYALSTLLNVMLALMAIPLILVSLGFSFNEVISRGRSLLFGFEVGGFRISLAQIAIAIALFAGVIFVTRLLQRWLAKRMVNNNGADRGLANSVRTGVGYVGFAVASLVAISYGGFDITNIAIIAGALSVGIGFGLQSIVNNFVSGLILLVERPIKVGDMIEVSGGQRGHVRRISVRSTEIETFDRASVIVPNADLITGSVTNLTHQNAMGRLLIPVGVAYDSDPVLVRQILEKIADDCDLIMPYPAPSVSFDELGASSLDFTMRVYVSDINNGLSAKTELRTQIVLAFREAGIEIPYPQQDIHLRDLDGVKQIVAQAIANRAKQTNDSSDNETTTPQNENPSTSSAGSSTPPPRAPQQAED